MNKSIVFLLLVAAFIIGAISFKGKPADVPVEDFKIIYSQYAAQIERSVKDSITMGWEPAGGTTFSGGNFIQAIVKRRGAGPRLGD